MIDHHPSGPVLTDYALGALPLAAGLTISAHLDSCPDCRRRVTDVEEHEASQLIDLHPTAVAANGLALVLEAVHDTAQAPDDGAATRKIEGVRLPAALAATGWRRRIWFAPGFWIAHTRASSKHGWRAFLLRAPAGAGLPRHGHRGGEFVAVLSGAFSDGRHVYGAGDFAECYDETEHDLVVSKEGPCLCLIASAAPLKWRGWAQLLRSLHGI